MKISKLISGLAIFSTVFLIASCSNPGGGYKTSAQMDSAQNKENAYIDKEINNERQEVKVKLTELIKTVDTRIDSLGAVIQKADKKEKKDLTEQKTKLEKDRDALKKHSDEVDKKANSDWKDFKSTLEAKMDSVKKELSRQ